MTLSWPSKGGGKKGFGKGSKGKGSKGKGSLYPMREVWLDPWTYDCDPWACYQGEAESLSSLKTIAPSLKAENVKQEDSEKDWNQVEGSTKKLWRCDNHCACRGVTTANRWQVIEPEEDDKDGDDADLDNCKVHFEEAEFPRIEESRKSNPGSRKMQRAHKWKNDKEVHKLQPIKTIEPESLNAFSNDGIWEEIEMAVDSGATESVVNDSMPSSIPTTPGPASRRGVEYEVANGTRIPNEGEKRFTAVTGQSQEKKLVVQVCDVNQGLLSVSKATAANNRVVFDSDGSYIENKESGEVTWLEEKKGMYMLKLWVKRPF